MNENLRRYRAARDFLLTHRTNYDAAVDGFRWPELDHFNWALDHFDDLARGNSASCLHIVGDDGLQTSVSFEEMRERSNRVANWLRSLGLVRGDRLLLMLGNEVPLWETMLASMKLGVVIIPATALLSRDDLIDRFERGRVRAVLTAAVHAGRFDGLDVYAPGPVLRIAVGTALGWHDYGESANCDATFVPDRATLPGEPLLLYFTSGTTSKPKLVEHTHVSYPVGHLTTLYWLGLRPGDRHWNISSPGWAKHAWSCFFTPWTVGATVFIFNQARFDATRTLQTLVAHRIDTLCAPPTVWRMLIQRPLSDYRVTLREAMSAGEPLNPEVIEQVRAAWGITIRDGYGQTETSAQIGNSPGQPLKPGSMGRPLPGWRVALLDADGNPADEGEIALVLDDETIGRPTGMMTGYADSIEKTAQVMQAGHYRTGDVAQRDADGYITYVGRADDVFKASDYRISPFELESVLIEHPAVAEAAVVPSPDSLKLAVSKAFVALAPGHAADKDTAQSVFAFCREKLAPYKRIRRMEFAELPKTISGKLRRVELRTREASRPMPPVAGACEYFDQ